MWWHWTSTCPASTASRPFPKSRKFQAHHRSSSLRHHKTARSRSPRLKAGAADYLVKDTQGDFIGLLDVAARSAFEQALVRKARDDAEAEVHASRDRYAALAAEREVLLREVNHRVGNSLQIIASLLHLQASSSSDDDVKAALSNAMGRVAAVAQVHRRLYTSQDLKDGYAQPIS